VGDAISMFAVEHATAADHDPHSEKSATSHAVGSATSRAVDPFMSPRRAGRSALVVAAPPWYGSTGLGSNANRGSFSNRKGKPGSKGPTEDLIRVIVETKSRNPQ
jgi:hypothetical protein